MLNTITVMGRITSEPELKFTQTGATYCSIRIAVDRDKKDRETGERRADFLPAVAWNGTAEFLCKYFSKGQMICVTGRLQSRDYTTQAGEKRSAVEIHVVSAYFADGGKREDAPKAGGPYYAPAGALTDDDAPPL